MLSCVEHEKRLITSGPDAVTLRQQCTVLSVEPKGGGGGQ